MSAVIPADADGNDDVTPKVRAISILGSTGSVGTSALSVVDSLPGRFRIIGLTANKNIELLERQILKYRPRVVAVMDEAGAQKLERRLKSGSGEVSRLGVEVYAGLEGLIKVACCEESDLVLSAVVGSQGLFPVLKAVERRKTVALANKESLVMAGQIIMESARRHGALVLPVDSEHNAIFQCLRGNLEGDVERIILTASGGPFYGYEQSRFASITPEEALKHPTWDMGEKITIDSATLMNKGLEIIEAKWLFGVDVDKIDVVIHPESVVHSLVEFVDGSMMAQLGVTDMRLPIKYALTYPERVENALERLDLTEVGEMRFLKPDLDRFPCLGYAYWAGRACGTMPAVLNAANEMAVAAFLGREIRFSDIPACIEKVMGSHHCTESPSLEEILQADQWAREEFLDVKGRLCS